MLAIGLQPVVGEAVVVGRGEEVERVLGRHGDIAVVDVAHEGVEGLPRGHHLADLDLRKGRGE